MKPVLSTAGCTPLGAQDVRRSASGEGSAQRPCGGGQGGDRLFDIEGDPLQLSIQDGDLIGQPGRGDAGGGGRLGARPGRRSEMSGRRPDRPSVRLGGLALRQSRAPQPRTCRPPYASRGSRRPASRSALRCLAHSHPRCRRRRSRPTLRLRVVEHHDLFRRDVVRGAPRRSAASSPRPGTRSPRRRTQLVPVPSHPPFRVRRLAAQALNGAVGRATEVGLSCAGRSRLARVGCLTVGSLLDAEEMGVPAPPPRLACGSRYPA